MKIRFLGTRGSTPAPSRNNVEFGGNTTCIEVITDDNTRVLIDAGTGIRKLNRGFVPDSENTIKMIFTHCHWDHLQGLPFFAQLFSKKNILIFILGDPHFRNIKKGIIKQMDDGSFPVQFNKIPAKIRFIRIKKRFRINKALEIVTFDNSHPGGSTGLKFIENDQKVFTFVTDNEIGLLKESGRYADFVDFCKGSDVIVHDAQYINDDMKIKKGWGHSTINDVAQLFIDALPGTGIFTHHDPERSDDEVKEMEREAVKKIKKMNIKMKIFAAKEDDVIEI